MSDEHVTTMPAGSEAIELLDTYQDRDLYRDSTVPIVVACRADVPMDSNTLRRIPDKHGNLQRNTAALDEVEGILTASSIIIKAAKPIPLRVDTPDSRSPARRSPYESRPPSPPGKRSASPSPTRPARSSKHGVSGHPARRSPSTGSRPARTPSTPQVQTSRHRSRP
jgi:hypothetical protein